jgi:predicted PurR-regulated permease PerM
MEERSRNGRNADRSRSTRQTLETLTIVAAFTLTFLFFWFAVRVLLLAFAGALLAILLFTLSEWVRKHSVLSHGLSLAVVLIGLMSILGAAIWLLAPELAGQVDELSARLPQSLAQLAHYLEQYSWGRGFVTQMSRGTGFLPRSVLAQATGVFSTTFNVLASVAIILFVGIYGAAEPGLYTEGFLRLVPVRKRKRVREILAQLAHTLRWWLIGRAVAMVLVGLLTSLGLWLLGVPLALTLGLLAAILTFIPYVGPILSVVPAALLALLQTPVLALYVVILYLVIQMTEGYLITPLVQERAVSLPPALTLLSQVIMAVLVGVLGLLLATPLAAAGMVLVKTLYVEDTLGDSDRQEREEATR